MLPSEASETSELVAVPPWLLVHARKLLIRWVRGKMEWKDLSEADKQALLKVAELFGEEKHG